MNKTGMIDLHCDTLVEWNYAKTGALDTLDDPARVVSLSKFSKGTRWTQCFAIFCPDEVRGDDALAYFDQYAKSFHRQMEKFSDRVAPCRTAAEMDAAFAAGKFAAVLTVEGGAVLAGELSRLDVLADAGVKIMTLVWNGANEIASGHQNPEMGFTEFGKSVVQELERVNIFPDVSHLNDKGFWELCELTDLPLLATHSNARSVCPHLRNLTDEQILEIVRRKGLIGLNYYVEFLGDGATENGFAAILRHTEHFLKLGAEDVLALGSDFDGATLPPDLDSAEKALGLADYLLSHGISEAQVEKIMFGNAMRFFREHFRE